MSPLEDLLDSGFHSQVCIVKREGVKKRNGGGSSEEYGDENLIVFQQFIRLV